MKQLRNIVAPMISALPDVGSRSAGLRADTGRCDSAGAEQENTVDVKEIVFGHIGDSYEWHITTWGKTHITIPLPIIVYSSTTGWHTFLSSRLAREWRHL